MRTSPQAAYSHNDRSSYSIDQWIALHGKPLAIVSVLMRPSLIRLSPPSSVAAHTAPPRSFRRPETWPLPSPSVVVYLERTCPSLKYNTPPSCQNDIQTPPRSATRTLAC